MLKQIQLKLKSIKYSGDSIGDDIRIEIECREKFISIKKKIKPNSEVNLIKDVGEFFTDSDQLNLLVKIKIIEEDLVFNDVGSMDVKLKINPNGSAPQISVHKIEVQELRNFISKKKASFDVKFEAVATNAILFVSHQERGWIKGLKGDSKKAIDLPAYLKVQLESENDKRQYFVIKEGVLTGVKASIKIENNGKIYLEKENNQSKAVRLKYSISKKILKFNNKIYHATDDRQNPWHKGIYDIEIPDYPHRGGHNYPQSKYATTWFRIGHNGDRYLHTGRVSLGCLTIVDVDRWDEIWEALIKARKGDDQSVGVLEVVD